MKNQRINLKNLEIYTFRDLENHIKKMKRLSKKNKDLDVLNDLKGIERGVKISKELLINRMNGFRKELKGNQSDDVWQKAIIIIRGLFKKDYETGELR